MFTLHDAEIVSYTVDFKSNTVTLFTEYWYDDTCSKNTVVFEQVVAHSFQDVGEMRNILFDIDCYDITQFLTDHPTLLENRKNYGWPLIHYDDVADLLHQLQQKNQNYYVISSSCGLTGFILAATMKCHESSKLFHQNIHTPHNG